MLTNVQTGLKGEQYTMLGIEPNYPSDTVNVVIVMTGASKCFLAP